MISIESSDKLEKLGKRLREARLEKNESQERFSARLGISVPTLRKMEKGDPTCSVGLWAEALFILDRPTDLDALLEKTQSLFDRRDDSSRQKRQRASKRKGVKGS